MDRRIYHADQVTRAGRPDAATCLLALHLAGHTLGAKLRKIFDAAESMEQFARVVLNRLYNQSCERAEQVAQAITPDEVVTMADPDYPPLLHEIYQAPFALFLRGNREILRGKMVSIVGTREPSPAGRQAAFTAAKYFTKDGFTVVSGIARGVDAIAHHAALENGGTTCAVLPNGFEHTYPLENRDIYQMARESRQVLLLSEYLPSEKPARYQFVRRNRLIAGLSALTVVVEAGDRSGAMITANHALQEGRDVAALSHSELRNNAGGSRLVEDGAIDLTPIALGAFRENQD